MGNTEEDMGKEDIKEIVEKTLKEIDHPEIAKTLFELGMIEDIRFDDGKVSFILKLPFREIPIKEFLIEDIKNTLKEKVSDIIVETNLKEMSQEEKAKFVKMAREAWRG